MNQQIYYTDIYRDCSLSTSSQYTAFVTYPNPDGCGVAWNTSQSHNYDQLSSLLLT